MVTIPKLALALQTLLSDAADRIACQTGSQRRRRKLTGPAFVQALVYGRLADPAASLHDLTRTAAALGAAVTPQALDRRFTPQAAALMRGVLHEAVGQLVAAAPAAIPVLRRFAATVVLDATTVGLPEALAAAWAGKGSADPSAGNAGLKLVVGLDLNSGRLYGPVPQPARQPDTTSPLAVPPLPPGGLRLADLGSWDLAAMARMGRDGVFWLSRLKLGTAVFAADGRRWPSPHALPEAQGTDRVELAVALGAGQRLPCRLIAERVPLAVAEARRKRLRDDASRQRRRASAEALAMCGRTALVTNAPAEKLAAAEALVLRRARWQIELLFKLWEGHGGLDAWRTGNPQRVLCEVYAELVAMVAQHWLTLLGCWSRPDRSAVKAARAVRRHAPALAAAAGRLGRLCEAIGALVTCLRTGCRMNPRRGAPNTYQLLLGLSPGP